MHGFCCKRLHLSSSCRFQAFGSRTKEGLKKVKFAFSFGGLQGAQKILHGLHALPTKCKGAVGNGSVYLGGNVGFERERFWIDGRVFELCFSTDDLPGPELALTTNAMFNEAPKQRAFHVQRRTMFKC